MANIILEITFLYWSNYNFFIFTYRGKIFSALYKSGIPGLFGGIILSIGFASYVFAMYETTVANANFIIQTQALFLAIFGYVF